MVDTRFILFIVDKFAGATHLIDELKLVRPKTAPVATSPVKIDVKKKRRVPSKKGGVKIKAAPEKLMKHSKS